MNESMQNSNFEPDNSKKNNKALISLIIILILLIIGLGGYLVYSEFIAKTAENKIKELDLYDICSTEEQQSICKRKLTLNNENVEISVISIESEDEYFYFNKLQINGNIITFDEENIKYIKAFQDLVILETFCTQCGGNSAMRPTTVIIDQTGKNLYTINDTSFENGYVYDNKYEIKDSKIIITAVKQGLGYFADYGPYPNFDCHINIEDSIATTGVDGMVIIKEDNYSQFTNIIAKIEYELEYIGNSKFSDVKKIKEIKFGELYSKEHCIDEFEEYERISKELEE